LNRLKTSYPFIMKLAIIVLFALFCLGQCEEWVPKTGLEIKDIRQECLRENPLSDEIITNMKQFIFPDEEPCRKYLLCTAVKMGVFCTHEGYHADRLAKQFKMDLDEAEVQSIAEGCIDKNEEGSPADVWAFRGHKCLMESKIGDRVRAYIKKKHESQQKTV